MSEIADNPLDALAAEAPSTSSEAEAVQPEGATGTQGQGQPDAAASSAVQPEGQGQPDATTGLYDLSTVPEEYRSEVERIAKDIDRNANAKFQEHAEFRQSWEPYGELGLQDVGPEGVGALLQFAEDVSNPETAREAIVGLAEALGVDLGDTAAPDGEDLDPVASLEQRFAAWEAKETAREEATREEAQIAAYRTQADQGYRAEFAEVEKLNGQPFSADERTQLIGLAKRFQLDHDEPIKAAYQLIQAISGGAEQALVNGQPRQPAQAEPAGRASSPITPVDSFEEAERLHRERNASAHA